MLEDVMYTHNVNRERMATTSKLLVHVPEAHAHPWLQDPVLEAAEDQAVGLAVDSVVAVDSAVAVDLAVESHETPQLVVADSEVDAPLKVCQGLNWYPVQPTCRSLESI